MNYKRFVIFLVFIVSVSLITPFIVLAESDDDFLDSLGLEIDEEIQISANDNEEVTIRDIDIKINGTTRQQWVMENLIIKKDFTYSLNRINRLIDIQKQYFKQTNLFYSIDIYITPFDGDYKLCIELTDGFMWTFNFVPYDVIVGYRHIENGNELLEGQLGYNTQGVFYNRPNVLGPVSYYAGFKHYYGKLGDDNKLNYIDLDGKLFFSSSIWANTGLDLSYRWYKYVNSLQSGNYIRLGVFTDIFPLYPFTNPFNANIKLSGGRVFEFNGNFSWYANAELTLMYKPLDFLSLELKGLLNYTSENAPSILHPKCDSFRSTSKLHKKNIYNINTFEIKFDRALSWRIVITDLTITPLLYAEAAGSGVTFNSFDEYKYAIGGGVIVGFESPVNAFFTFGIKWGVNDKAPGFLFEAKSSLF